MADLTLDEIKDALRKMDAGLSEDDDGFKAQVVMVSSLQVGPNVSRLAAFTGISKELITNFSRNLRKNGVWRGTRVYANWFETDGGIDFLLDTNVALGCIERR